MEWLSLFPYIPRFADLYNDILLDAHAYKHAMNLDGKYLLINILLGIINKGKYDIWEKGET